jgi:hypothetical protein
MASHQSKLSSRFTAIYEAGGAGMWLAIVALFVGATVGALIMSLCASKKIGELEYRVYRFNRRAQVYWRLARTAVERERQAEARVKELEARIEALCNYPSELREAAECAPPH